MNCGIKWATLKYNFINIADILLKRISKHCGKKTKDITEK